MNMKRTFLILVTFFFEIFLPKTGMAVELAGVDIHGFISQGYLATLENDSLTSIEEDDSFVFNEVGLNFGNDLTDDLHIGIQLFARDFHETGSVDVKIDWAFADYHFRDWFGMRFGQMKTPHGLYNEIRDIDMLRNPIFLPESVYHELSHDLYISDLYLAMQGISSRELFLSLQGLGIYGFVDLDTGGGLSYQIMYGTQNLEPDKQLARQQTERFLYALSGLDVSNDILEPGSTDVDYKYAANLIWDVPFEGLRLGLSLDNIKMANTSRFTQDLILPHQGEPVTVALAGDFATVEYEKLENWVGSLEYTWNNFIVMAEYIRTIKEYDVSTESFVNKLRKKGKPWGWYLGGAYRFSEWFELGGYYSRSETDEFNIAAMLPPIDYYIEFGDYCVTARFDINAYWTLKLEAHQFSSTYARQNAENFGTNIYTRVEEEWNLYAAKVTVAF